MAESPTTGKPLTLVERIGGSKVVDQMVGAFYQRILADPELLPLFEIASNAQLEQMQREFFAAAFDEWTSGENQSRPSPTISSAPSGIPSRYYPRFLDHFVTTLKAHRLGDDDTRTIVARLHRYLYEVIGLPQADES